MNLSYLNYALKPLTVLLAMLIGVWTASLSWQFINKSAVVDSQPIKPANVQNQVSVTPPLGLANQISAYHLFGEKVREAPAAQKVAVETKLNLKIKAIFSQEGFPELGLVTIAQGNGKEKLFKAGDSVFGKATLKEIYAGHVVIDRQGKLENLSIEKFDISKYKVEQPALDLSSNYVAPQNSRAPSLPSVNKFTPSMSRGNAAVGSTNLAQQVKAYVETVQMRAQQDPEGLIRDVGVEQVNNGYLVTRRARQLHAIGLQPGDIVRYVNDMPVGDLQQDQRLMNEVIASGQVKVVFDRGGEQKTILQTIPKF